MITPLSRPLAPRVAPEHLACPGDLGLVRLERLADDCTWLGWMQALSVNPDAAASSGSAASPSRSEMFT